MNAKWIWLKQKSDNPYNQTIIARKSFRMKNYRRAVIRITADGFYRLYLNGQWINDGPARSWSSHYSYDEIDVTTYLAAGENQITIVGRYYGVGLMRQMPQRPGLLAQLDITLDSGKTQTIATDKTWQVAAARAWVPNTPKICTQMEPAEWYDARLESTGRFGPAAELFAADKGPWKDLQPRGVPLMTRNSQPPQAFCQASLVKTPGQSFCFPVERLMHPDWKGISANTTTPLALATIIRVKKACTVKLETEAGFGKGLRIAIDGQENSEDRFRLKPGSHLLLAFPRRVPHAKDRDIYFDCDDLKFENPVDRRSDNPWCYVPFHEYACAGDDMDWVWFWKEDKPVVALSKEFDALCTEWIKASKDSKAFVRTLREKALLVPRDQLILNDGYWQFCRRESIGNANKFVENAKALMHDTPDLATIRPSTKGDIELVYDLGQQRCGYYQFECLAPAGAVIDIYGVEHIDHHGRRQLTSYVRNGMRYITKAGINRFVSLKRRSGRYLFVTVRNSTNTPVRFRNLGIIESTYPVSFEGQFHCENETFNRIWEISAHTLKLCMEDTFTDCPLYEQIYWIGDARNESLCAYPVFGAADIARRGLTLAAQSLEHYPLIAPQAPTAWKCLLPAWSFLWGIAVWEHYWHTGDKAFLKHIWPAVIKNLQGAQRYISERGLFTGPFWNMFDWANIDHEHQTVLHNSMFVVGAIEAAIQCGRAIQDRRCESWLKKLKQTLCWSINELWSEKKKAYPDSIYQNGDVSPSTCQHTSFLALLYDISEPKHRSVVLNNVLNSPKSMVKVGSPFAMFFLYEALEKAGRHAEIIQSIFLNYRPMLDEGATTVWESFASGTLAHGEFPTRSHCHGWSAAPLYFLPRVILGVRQTSPGGKSYEISPLLCGLKHAEGSIASVNGPLTVRWRIDRDTLFVDCLVPQDVRIVFKRNASHGKHRIVFNVTRRPAIL